MTQEELKIKEEQLNNREERIVYIREDQTGLKINYILSMSPLGILTFGIWPLITTIILLVRHKEFLNSEYAIITAILGFFFFWFLVPFIMGFFLKVK